MMKGKGFRRGIRLQIGVMVLAMTAAFPAAMTLAAFFMESVQPRQQRLTREDIVDRLVMADAGLDRQSLQRATQQLFPPAIWTTEQETGLLPPLSVWIGLAAWSSATFVIMTVWATRQLIRPLHALAEAADTFSVESAPANLSRRGPREVQVAALALARMQKRIRSMVGERTEMLARIGHDLRIPITRLHLRAEFMDDAMRSAVTRDLDLMSRLVDGALAHLRVGRWSPSRSEVLYLSDFVERVCRDFADTGAPVAFEATDHPVVRGRREDIERALNSLIDNAIKYGLCAFVRVIARDGMAVVEVKDEGPGIPEKSMEHLMKPFVRGDVLGSGSGSVGLGLSTAKVIAKDHGGYLSLANTTGSGLLAQLALPLIR